MTKDVKTYRAEFHRIDFKAAGCPKCGSLNVLCYGNYFRKKAGVYVKRLYCKDCGATPGWLPPFLMPYKHYPIPEVLPAVKKYLRGTEGLLTSWTNAPEMDMSFPTFRRWIHTFASMASELYMTAAAALAQWKPDWKFECDKRLRSASFPLAGNQELNLLYQIFVMEDYFVFDSVDREDFLPWLIFQLRQRAGPARQLLTP